MYGIYQAQEYILRYILSIGFWHQVMHSAIYLRKVFSDEDIESFLIAILDPLY